VIVDGMRVAGAVSCDGETVKIELETLPRFGMHFLQVQNPSGLVSNDFIFHVAENETMANALLRRDLGSVLRDARWDRLIGTWVDPGTRGKNFKTTYTWKIKDVLIETVHKDSSSESVALIAINPETGDIRHMGGDAGGSMFTGTWTFAKSGDATLEVAYANTDSQKGTLKLRYRLKDDDTLDLTVFQPQSKPITLIRLR
jgi:hypothetical protein